LAIVTEALRFQPSGSKLNSPIGSISTPDLWASSKAPFRKRRIWPLSDRVPSGKKSTSGEDDVQVSSVGLLQEVEMYFNEGLCPSSSADTHAGSDRVESKPRPRRHQKVREVLPIRLGKPIGDRRKPGEPPVGHLWGFVPLK